MILLLFSSLTLVFIQPAKCQAPNAYETATEWKLSNGKIEIGFNKSYPEGWVTSFTYDGFDFLDGAIKYALVGNKWQVGIYANAAYYNLENVTSASYGVTSEYAELNLHVECVTYSDLFANITYRLYPDRLEFIPSLAINFQWVENCTFRNVIATNYTDWDSIISFGGDHSYSVMSQANDTLLYDGGQSFNWNYHYLGNNNSMGTYARPMCVPLVVFSKNDLAISLSLSEKNYTSEAYFNLHQYTGGNLYYTEFGQAFDINVGGWQNYTTQFNIDFYELNGTRSWLQAYFDYNDNLITQNNWTSLLPTAPDSALQTQHLTDLWPIYYDNETVIEQMKTLNAKVLWLYGWHSDNETYPLSGSWNSTAGTIPLTAIYLNETIRSLQAEGFKVYLYMRSQVDFNETYPIHPDWISRCNSTSYLYSWVMPNGNIAARGALSNQEFEDYLFSTSVSLYETYHPDGLALDHGGIGAELQDGAMDYCQGSYYNGLMNLTIRLRNASIPFLINGEMLHLALFSDGTLAEDPGYCLPLHIELSLIKYYNCTGYLLTTGHTPTDQTVEQEIAYNNLAISAGINRGFDMSTTIPDSLFDDTFEQSLNHHYSIFWSHIGTMRLQPFSVYLSGDNFRITTANTFASYFGDSSSKLWIIIFNNNTDKAFTLPLYSFSNQTVTLMSFYDSTVTSEILTLEGNEKTVYLLGNTLSDRDLTLAIPMPFFSFNFIFGIIGLLALIVGPAYGIKQMQNHEYQKGIVNAVIFGMVGFALFIGWLWA